MTETYDDGQARGRPLSLVVTPCLMVALECDRPLAGSRRVRLDGIDRITIGRGDVRSAIRVGPGSLEVRVPGRSMSAAHARLVRVGFSWMLEDLGSKNGTFVGGERVSRVVLRPDAFFDAGHSFFRVRSLALPHDAAADLDARGEGAFETMDGAFGDQLARARSLVASGLPALLLGESGTGKEVLARALHESSGRSGPLVAVNCGALPASLVESQLFGHVKGAFSGALRDQDGLVRSAHGGTLFLDEIADLPLASQAALLRVLQEREVVPVGATRPIAVDVRVIAATHQPLKTLVERGAFREDLFARIAGCVLEIPALRDRRDDMGLLVASLLERLTPASAPAIWLTLGVGRALLAYDWPMNVRELERSLATGIALAPGGEIGEAQLPPGMAGAARTTVDAGPADPWGHLNERDQRLRLELLAHLSQFRGNVSEVARAMGKGRTQIHRWCTRFAIDPDAFRD